MMYRRPDAAADKTRELASRKKTFEAPMHRDEREDIESAMYGKW